MVRSEANRIRQVLDQIDLTRMSFFYDLPVKEEKLRKRYEYFPKELGVSETLLYKEALKLFINLEPEWLGKNN